jgi:hypothetical protein
LNLKPTDYSGAKAGANASVACEHNTAREATFEETKMDGLCAAAIPIRGALLEAQRRLGQDTTLIVLDDFYQPRELRRPSGRSRRVATGSDTGHPYR